MRIVFLIFASILTIQSLSFNDLNTPFNDLNDQMVAAAPDFLFFQERLKSVLDSFLTQQDPYLSPFLLLKGDEEYFFHSLLSDYVKTQLPKYAIQKKAAHFHYQINARNIQLLNNKSHGNFATAEHSVQGAISFYPSQLFGFVREPEHGLIHLEPGLIHKANGGVLILNLTQLLEQPDCLKFLKQIAYSRSFPWLSPDPTQPFSISIPPLPMDVKIILISDRLALSDLQLIDPLFFNQCFYGEFEGYQRIKNKNYEPWLSMIQFVTFSAQKRLFEPNAYELLLKEGMKYCEDQSQLPSMPSWIVQLLKLLPQSENNITRDQLQNALEQAKWKLDYLPEQLSASILEKHVTIYTQGELIGQINGLSVLEYPGYPLEIGEPSRISCVLAFGEGNIIDVERKTELGGNLHSKGMMIMQSLLDTEFSQQQHLPFDFSLVFEQSYNEIDGDSASLAGFCALLSSLSKLPIYQEFAITGSIDQNGNVQAIGGVNKKIEGFFKICQQRGLTGKQAVIIPEINQSQLCLNDDIMEAIQAEQFSIFTVSHFSEAIELLTGLPYSNETPFNLKKIIQSRINQMLLFEQTKKPKSFFSLLRFLKA